MGITGFWTAGQKTGRHLPYWAHCSLWLLAHSPAIWGLIEYQDFIRELKSEWNLQDYFIGLAPKIRSSHVCMLPSIEEDISRGFLSWHYSAAAVTIYSLGTWWNCSFCWGNISNWHLWLKHMVYSFLEKLETSNRLSIQFLLKEIQ